MMKYNFISGLPRSGTTLLSSILKQNPRFHASISDPLHEYTKSIIRDTNSMVGMNIIVPEPKLKHILLNTFSGFYNDINKDVCFNTNRAWTADTNILKSLFPDFKMIVMVRDIRSILNSFETLHLNNPYELKPIYHYQELNTVYERSNMLMGNIDGFGGYVQAPLQNLQQSCVSKEKDQLLFIEYKALSINPKETMKKVYDFLEETPFVHDFNNVRDSYPDFDRATKLDGLHTIRKSVEYKQIPRVLPSDLWNNYTNANFWVQLDKSNLNWISS